MGKVAEALPLAERALADPASAEGAPELLANAAAAFLEVGRIEAADGLLRILAEKAPRTASLSWNLAVLAWRRGDVAGARARASAIPPPMASLWPVVASRFAWDRGQVAIPDSGGLSRAEPRVAALSRNLEAWARFREGNAGAAERIISPLASQDAFPAELATNLGIVQAEQGKWSEAQANLERAVRARPDLAEGWLNLGLFLDIYRGEAAGARDCYEKYVRLNGVRKEEVRKWIERLDRSAPQRPPSP